MPTALRQGQKATCTCSAEFLWTMGGQRVRATFRPNAPPDEDILEAPGDVVSIYFTRQTIDWDAPALFETLQKHVIVFGCEGYWRNGSVHSQPWTHDMKPPPSPPPNVPVPLAVQLLCNPAILARAAAKLLGNVTAMEMAVIEQDLQRAPKQPSTPPSTPDHSKAVPPQPLSCYCEELAALYHWQALTEAAQNKLGHKQKVVKPVGLLAAKRKRLGDRQHRQGLRKRKTIDT